MDQCCLSAIDVGKQTKPEMAWVSCRDVAMWFTKAPRRLLKTMEKKQQHRQQHIIWENSDLQNKCLGWSCAVCKVKWQISLLNHIKDIEEVDEKWDISYPCFYVLVQFYSMWQVVAFSLKLNNTVNQNYMRMWHHFRLLSNSLAEQKRLLQSGQASDETSSIPALGSRTNYGTRCGRSVLAKLQNVCEIIRCHLFWCL